MANQYRGIAKEILLYLAAGVAITLALTSPYAGFYLWKKLTKKKTSYEKELEERKKFSQALARLKKSRLVITAQTEEGFMVDLTEKGKRKVQELQVANLKIKKQERWDGIWRVVIADIPNKKKKARDALREKLKYLGFYKLQESVWAIPYPCNNEIKFLIELFQLYPYVNILETQKIEYDAQIRKYFHLL